MSKLNSWMPRAAAAAFVACLVTSSILAQQAPTVRIRGTIESVDGNTLGIKTR